MRRPLRRSALHRPSPCSPPSLRSLGSGLRPGSRSKRRNRSSAVAAPPPADQFRGRAGCSTRPASARAIRVFEPDSSAHQPKSLASLTKAIPGGASYTTSIQVLTKSLPRPPIRTSRTFARVTTSSPRPVNSAQLRAECTRQRSGPPIFEREEGRTRRRRLEPDSTEPSVIRSGTCRRVPGTRPKSSESDQQRQRGQSDERPPPRHRRILMGAPRGCNRWMSSRRHDYAATGGERALTEGEALLTF